MSEGADWMSLFDELERGEKRAASPQGDGWVVHEEVKKGILAAFKAGKNAEFSGIYEGFVDKDNLPPRMMGVSDGVRLVPGGSSIRRGAYVAKGVIMMPPSYINVGAYVDEGSMVDSHVLVGSCAQVGKRVHLSAGVQLGGVLEPIGMAPVIIEDDCFLGANVVVVEGIRVRRGAVLAPGLILSKAVPVFDLVQGKRMAPGADIPENAVVVPGSRPVLEGWGADQGLSMSTPLLVKYRDEGSDAALAMEQSLR